MSPLEELRSGTIGDEFVALLIRTVLAVGPARNFPPPDGNRWNAQAAADVSSSFLSDPGTPRRIKWLILRCGDDRALAGALETIVRNFLADLGRQTELGRLVVRVRRALRECNDFVQRDGGYWGLADGPAEPSGAGPDELEAAAATVGVTHQSWSPTSRRHAPFADKVSIEAMITATLTAAEGTLPPNVIARALAPSLNVAPTSGITVELDPGDHPEHLFPRAEDIGDLLADEERALEVASVLTDRERIAIAYNHLSVRELATLIGVGRTQTNVIQNRAIEILKAELGTEERGDTIALLVKEICETWVADRTSGDDSPFPSA